MKFRYKNHSAIFTEKQNVVSSPPFKCVCRIIACDAGFHSSITDAVQRVGGITGCGLPLS